MCKEHEEEEKMTTTKTFKGNGADKILAEKIIKKLLKQVIYHGKCHGISVLMLTLTQVRNHSV